MIPRYFNQLINCSNFCAQSSVATLLNLFYRKMSTFVAIKTNAMSELTWLFLRVSEKYVFLGPSLVLDGGPYHIN